MITLKQMGLEDAVIVDSEGNERCIEIDIEELLMSNSVWDFANRQLGPGEHIFFGHYQAGTA
jgi:hypothetical protein